MLRERLANATPDRPEPLGRYDVIGRLGHGGMGTVYDAIDRERNTQVALKTLSAPEPSAVVGLKREFRTVADLAHPHLARVYELGEDRGIWFFTMERIDGISLAKWARGQPDGTSETEVDMPLTRSFESTVDVATITSSNLSDRPLGSTQWLAAPPSRDVAEIREALRALVNAIASLHDTGLFHGDIKPANVLVREDGHLVVVDFGLARPLERTGRSVGDRSSAGTPAYMSPEQLHAPRHDGPQSDWYAFGATLYRILTGWLPFAAGSLLDLYLKKKHCVPPSPRELASEVPADLSDLAMALLNPEPDKRPGRDEILRMLGNQGHEDPAPSQRVRHKVFVGRERELFMLERAYGSARAGRLILVHAHGSSGIGKSSLLDSFLRGVVALDRALVLRGRCYERESVPYKGFDRMIDALADHLRELPEDDLRHVVPTWIGELATVFPALASVPEIDRRMKLAKLPRDAMELRRRAWLALAQLFAALRAEGPVVLVIDDLQWADRDSAQLLEALIHGSVVSPLLVLASYRPEADDNPALAGYFERSKSLEPTGALVEVALEPLDARETEQLARATLTAMDVACTDERVKSLAAEAKGVPFFVEELAHFEAAREGDQLSEGRVSLDDAIRARIAKLPDNERALVEVIAVAGTPVAQSVAFEAAGLNDDQIKALLALRGASLVTGSGMATDDEVACYHDRVRESVMGALTEDAEQAHHLALGWVLARRHESDAKRPWVFEAVRHLAAANMRIEDPSRRLKAAALHAEAAKRARRAAAFPLAFRCFEEGIPFLPDDAWDTEYELALELHAGAAEAAYLSAQPDALEERATQVKQHARNVMDQMLVWEVQIDSHAGRQHYVAAVETGVHALALLGVNLPADPNEEQVGAAVKDAIERLTATGVAGMEALPDVQTREVAAAMRIQVRMSPAAYFGRPLLLPIIASNLIGTSIDKGLSNATPYALALFGIVLNTLEMFPVSHKWGQLALRLADRYDDRSLEAATRHVVFNLVCNWVVPLSTTLSSLREVFDIGCRTGDFEYASYAAHGYVHNSIYAAKPLEPLLAEALDFGVRMRALGEVNALHVHVVFEQLIKALTGRTNSPFSLDDDTFSHDRALVETKASGSSAGQLVLYHTAGLLDYLHGERARANAWFVEARKYVSATPSVWHIPILHQFSGLAACAQLDVTDDERERQTLREVIEASIAALERLTSHCEVNFAHRLSMVQGELRRVDGDAQGAIELFEQCIEQARAGSWVNDIALANELAADCHTDPDQRQQSLRAARAAYSAWGASAKAKRLADAMATP